MAETYSDPILEGKAPQYAYVLAILSGGAAFIVSQLGDPTVCWFFYALLAAVFASVWPGRAFHWVAWLCLPILLLIFFDILVTESAYGLWRNGPILIKAIPSTCLGAFVGSKIPARRIALRFAARQSNRKRLSGNENGAQANLVSKETMVPVASLKTPSFNRNLNGPSQAAAPAAHFDSFNGPLLQAAQEGDLDRIRLLVADGADVNAKSSDQWTPLMVASLADDTGMVKSLFGEGALSEASSGKGLTALMIATIEGHVEVVRALLEHGAEINARDDKGWTALRFAVSMDETEILHVLLDAGADVNCTDHEGTTALMQAAGENIRESLEALLVAGADPHIRDHHHQTALMIARKRNHTQIIKLLKEAEAKVSTDTQASASALEDVDSYFYLLKEELEEGLSSQASPSTTDGVVSRLLSELQAVQKQIIEATKKDRSLAPSEISHKLMLTLKEASALTGLPRLHLLEAIEEKRLKAQLLEHIWRIKRVDLDDYIRHLG